MDSMRMLNDGEDADAEVTWQDQTNINNFSRLNTEVTDLEEQYSEKQKENEYLEDVTTELELADDDEQILYKIGDAFVYLGLEEAKERLEANSTTLTQDMTSLQAQIDDHRSKMSDLKAKLYAKFGKQINLELDN